MNKSTLTRGRLEIFTIAMENFAPHRIRTIRVWLPEGYQERDMEKKYPVLYMHDGQNLFDALTSFAGEWEVDETLGKMMDEGYAGMIVVGIDNGEEERLNEYSPPWPLKDIENTLGTKIVSVGDKYALFVVEILKPYIDKKYNTLTDKSNTGIGGSSMGGIISFYTALSYQDIFGFALIFSSSLWIYEDDLAKTFISKQVSEPNRVPKMYLYHGTREGSYAYLKEVARLLEEAGVTSDKYKVAIGKNAKHNEKAWAKAFPTAIKWLVDFK